MANLTASTQDNFDWIELYNPLNNHDPIQAELAENLLQQGIKIPRIKEENTKLDSLKEALNQQKKNSL